jgi:hypothetical protein
MQKLQQYENNLLNANSGKIVDLPSDDVLEELDDAQLAMISGGIHNGDGTPNVSGKYAQAIPLSDGGTLVIRWDGCQVLYNANGVEVGRECIL